MGQHSDAFDVKEFYRRFLDYGAPDVATAIHKLPGFHTLSAVDLLGSDYVRSAMLKLITAHVLESEDAWARKTTSNADHHLEQGKNNLAAAVKTYFTKQQRDITLEHCKSLATEIDKIIVRDLADPLYEYLIKNTQENKGTAIADSHGDRVSSGGGSPLSVVSGFYNNGQINPSPPNKISLPFKT